MTMMNSELYTALKAAGVAEAEARAAASSVLSAELGATKADIAELRAATKADIAELRGEVKADIAELRAATKDDIAQLRTELYRLIAGQTIVLVGIMAALKLFG